MIIYIVDADPEEEEFFTTNLTEHEVRCVRGTEDVSDDAEIVCVFIRSKVDAAFITAHPRLRLVATRSNSLDHIDVAACQDRGISVSHVPNYGENTVAEHTFALILALARRLREVLAWKHRGRFSYEEARGMELSGKTLGILGMGRIGQRVVVLARAFEMNVIAHDVDAHPELQKTLGFDFVPFGELLRRSDIVSLHASLSPATYHILNGATLAQCRRGVLIINTARGALIETQALREALDSGHVGGAGLDVLQDERVLRDTPEHIIGADIVKHLRSDAQAHEARDAERVRELQELMLGDALLARRNVIFTPHVAFNTVEAVQRICARTLENIKTALVGSAEST